MTTVDLVQGITIKGKGFPVLVRTEAEAGKSSGWCARLDEGPDPYSGLRLEFLYPERKEVDRKGNGQKGYRILTPGVFQAETVHPSHRPYRILFSVGSDGDVEVLGTTAEASPQALEERAMDRLVAMKLLQEI